MNSSDIAANITEYFEGRGDAVRHAGARTLRGAKANCGDPSLTGGDLVMTQYFDKGFDANYLCP